MTEMKEFLKRAWQEVVWTRDYYTTLDASERRLIPRIRYVHFKLHQQEQARITGVSPQNPSPKGCSTSAGGDDGLTPSPFL